MSDPASGAAVATSLRRSNLAAVAGFAWDSSVFTATDVMAAVGLTRSTSIDVIDELVDRGILRELPNARVAGDYRKGRPARRFELRADAAAIVGVDAGRAHVTVIVADLRGDDIVRVHVDLDSTHDSAPERRDAVAAAIDGALDGAGLGRADVVAVCVGVPAPVDADGVSPAHPDTFWTRMNPDFSALISEWAPIVHVENDASLAAVAEGAWGAAVGCSNYVSLLAGDRLGAGIVIDGRLLRGAHGGAGEMVFLDDIPAVGGAWGLGFRAAEWAREAIESGSVAPDSGLLDVPIDRIDAPLVFALARQGDADARRVVDRVALALATILGIFGSLFDVSLVVVSGAISAGIDVVLDATLTMTPGHLDLPAPRIVASPLGADVVAIGAVARARAAARADIPALTRSATASS
ncbi:ROK family protein [Microbacterium deminutum]|uniref:ROK family protein n=1 Tax=Microbacterium deminutum TaxID=344164 RepID=A0ABP5C1J6_9MICO